MVFMRGLCLLTLGKKVSLPLPAFFAFNSAKFLSQLHRAVDNAESHYLQPHYETHSISASSSSLPLLQSSVNTVCSMVLQSYYEQFEKKLSPHRLNLERIDPESLTHDQAITVVASLAKEGGSMAALGFFNWAIGFPKFRYFMRLYIVCAGSLIDNGNLVKAQQVMSYMVLSFSEIGRLSQAVDMIFEMNNQGLPLNGHLVNCVTRVACDMGLVEYAEKVFDDMCARGVSPTSCTCSFKSMVVGYCRLGRVLEASKWLHEMVDRKIVIDNATCSLVINSLCLQDSISKAFWFFNQMIGMGFTPNLINFTALINGLCKKGKIKHAFEVLEEMVRRGWKPNVYTHTAVIDGLCKKGWTEKAFRLFLKLVRSDCYKPNVCTYTAMIYGYCKEGKLNRAEMLYSRMKEQELVPNVNTYTTLISGHCKEGNFSRAYKLMDIMTTEDLTLSISVYNAVSSGLCKKGRISEAFDLLRKGIQCGAEADEITYTILISTSCRQVDTVTSLAYFCKMNKSGIRADIYTYNALLGALCRQKRMEESERLFKEALELDLVPTKETYTSLICGYCRNASICLGLAYFHRMVDHGCQPDSFAYGTLISGLCKESRLEEANQLYKAMVEKGLTPSEVTRLTVAYEYCKRDNSASALSTLEHLERKLWVRTVRTLVRKLCSEGRAEMGVLFFRKLLEKEQNADRVTMAAVLTACYESGKYELVSGLSENIQNGRKNRLLSVAPQPA